MYTAAADQIRQFDLSVAYDITTASGAGTADISNELTNNRGVYFKDDGTAFYVSGFANVTCYRYNMSVAWDITTATYSNDSFTYTDPVDGSVTFGRGPIFNPEGTRLIVAISGDTDRVLQYFLSTPWDITTASYEARNEILVTVDNTAGGVIFSNDGEKLFFGGVEQDSIFEFSTDGN